MTAHPQENPDAYEGAGMDAEMDARKRGCMTDAGKEAEKQHKFLYSENWFFAWEAHPESSAF